MRRESVICPVESSLEECPGGAPVVGCRGNIYHGGRYILEEFTKAALCVCAWEQQVVLHFLQHLRSARGLIICILH